LSVERPIVNLNLKTPAGVIFLLAIVCLVATALRWFVFDLPLERDEGEYAYMAQRWLLGELPYQTTFDQKPPGIIVAYLLLIHFFGLSPAAIHFGAHLYSLGTLILIFLLGRILFAWQVGFVAAVFAALLLTDPSVFGNAANTEVFMILPMVASLIATLLAIRRDNFWWSFISGILGTLALLLKQVAIPCILFNYMLLLWQSKRKLQHILAASGGLLLPLLLTVAYFIAKGAWLPFYDCTIRYNLSYVSANLPMDYAKAFLGTTLNIFISVWPVYALALLAVIMECADKGTAKSSSRQHKWVLFGWLCSSFIGTAIGGNFRQHQFIQIIPAVSLFAALGVNDLVLRFKQNNLRWAVAFILIIFPITYSLWVNAWYYASGNALKKVKHCYIGNPFAESIAVADFIKQRTKTQDSIFIFGSEPQIFFYANRRSASRYIFSYPLMSSSPDVLERQQSVMHEIAQNKPIMIITVFCPSSLLIEKKSRREIIDQLAKVLADFYHIVGVVPMDARNPALLLKDSAAVAYWTKNSEWYQGQCHSALAIWMRKQ